ncbi:bifunctional homocysteine S-methyltransferase/methylenetetrahydrofolate reductase [Phytohabitans sp. ZYX-F-186]|uniref:Bifunctional homocysteine S-methyltransferase/methylenetetrahydrofolate reductase n=1 Tax=Phytohabitans maris TaxID=3071409 RepID=A0ABU0ZKD5_9ACTN|nr:bifunctional homocysteine S-methyltransferase/methylenetetrahydrofolate reductase [Phytohabitans sp. ZYX-F-186]MDQ7907518.1 bifunctional homocysteine S-methyltransferase/methylenetetrahydrofolate reductase [Phytohabitans sp. ZYX-F-186]
MSVRSELAAMLRRRVLVCDGAMGTVLHSVGNSLDQSLVELNLSNPALVRSVHDSYVEAGADIVQTNTFGASRLRLAGYGYADAAADINRAGVAIARAAAEAAGHPVFVAGSVSPAVTVRQRAKATPAERRSALRDQIGALAQAGVDLVVLETFGYLDELVEAIDVAVEVSDLPLVAQSTFATDGRTLSGHAPAEVVSAVVARAGTNLFALGVNCTLGPQGSLAVLVQLAERTSVPLSVQPNAGLPRRVAPDRFEYEVDSDYFGRYAQKMVAAGAAVVGGCCGTTPEHIRAVVDGVSSAAPERSRRAAVRPPAERAAAAHPPSGLLGDVGFVLGGLVALTAADATDPAGQLAGVLRRAALAHEAGVDLVCVRSEPGVRLSTNPVSAGTAVQDQLGLRAVAGVSTAGKSIMRLQASLLGAHARGVTRIICETGTPTLAGDYPNADGRWDVDSVGLAELLAGLNAGADHNGLRLASRTRFEIGAWINPGARNFAAELRRTRAKLDAGVHFLVTRPIFEHIALSRMLEVVAGRVPVLVSLRALTSFKEAEYLRHEVPDVVLPDSALGALARAGAAQRRVGVELAVDLAQRVAGLVGGLLVGVDDDPSALVEVQRAVKSLKEGHLGP